MEIGIDLLVLLVLLWLIGDAVIVMVALLGGRAQDRRAARLRHVPTRAVSPAVTLRVGAPGRRSTRQRSRRPAGPH